MLRRLLALLLLLALSAPALAMSGHCAEMPSAPTVHAGMHDGGRHPAPAQPERRDCIGCVLPGLGLAAPKPPAPVVLVGAAPPCPALVLGRGRPEVPPPKS